MRMRPRGRGLSIIAGVILVGVLAGCATPVGSADPSPTRKGPPPASEEVPATVATPTADAGAIARAHTWLDSASVPDGAVRVEAGDVPAFHSFVGWPCTPVATLTGYWRIPDADAVDTVNWLAANPTPGLTVPFMPQYPAGNTGEMSVGQLPTPDSQEGIVFDVMRIYDGSVVIRAQVAALAADATCADPGSGSRWGAPGQG